MGDKVQPIKPIAVIKNPPKKNPDQAFQDFKLILQAELAKIKRA